jgi:uncharacterized membrane protein
MASCLQAQLARVSVVLNGAGDLVLADACKEHEDEQTAQRSSVYQPHYCQQKHAKTQRHFARCIDILMSCLIWSFWSAARKALLRAFCSSWADAASASELLVRRAVAWSVRRSASAGKAED